uniref:Uncharacterized protein n=1 Tax=Myotis myotis TaxID=51298 RepID=A0A7J7S1Y3_MYOMY|nr:hypothetical protein mMyoMyo1_010093 [Myotis myotis]
MANLKKSGKYEDTTQQPHPLQAAPCDNQAPGRDTAVFAKTQGSQGCGDQSQTSNPQSSSPALTPARQIHLPPVSRLSPIQWASPLRRSSQAALNRGAHLGRSSAPKPQAENGRVPHSCTLQPPPPASAEPVGPWTVTAL